MSDTSATPATVPPGEDNTVAILSYLTLIGFIVAIVLHSNKKTQLGTFHLQQALGLVVTAIAGGITLLIFSVILAFIPLLGVILSGALSFGFTAAIFVLAVIGFIGALNRQTKPLPVVGELYKKWFGGAFI